MISKPIVLITLVVFLQLIGSLLGNFSVKPCDLEIEVRCFGEWDPGQKKIRHEEIENL